MANALGIDPNQIVFHPVTLGGDFGGKGSPMNIPLGYFLSKAVGKPVRMVFDYTEEFMAANPRHASRITVRTGVKRGRRNRRPRRPRRLRQRRLRRLQAGRAPHGRRRRWRALPRRQHPGH